jgi:citrate lyase subunit beta / citryl-CoA lyase
MPTSARPRRSVLYMPGSNARALEKARTLPADGLILDLEDAVAPDAKEVARNQVCQSVKDGGYGMRELAIRVNGLATPWGYADVAAASRAGAHAILLPKVESADAIRYVEASWWPTALPTTIAIWAMMETPRGMLAAGGDRRRLPRMACLVMGTSDLAKELHCAHTRERLPMMTSLGLCLLAARSYGWPSSTASISTSTTTRASNTACRQGVELGFDGKTLIHPRPSTPATAFSRRNRKRSPGRARSSSPTEAAAAEGKGVVVVDGKLIENLHVENAKRLVAMAEAIEKMQSSRPLDRGIGVTTASPRLAFKRDSVAVAVMPSDAVRPRALPAARGYLCRGRRRRGTA